MREARHRLGLDEPARLDVPGRAHAIWIGGADAGPPASVGLVVTVAGEVAPLRLAGVVERRHEFDDSRWRPVPLPTVRAAVAAAVGGLADTDVLVRCRRGANRSALIVALVLREAGLTSVEAIATVRARRGALALSNPYFAALVHQWPRDPMEARDE